MALIDEIRRKNPSLSDRSDDEIKSILRQSPEFQYFDDAEFDAYVSGEPSRERPDATPGFTGGLAAGIDQVQGMGGGLVMAAGEALESEGLLNAGRDIYSRNMDEAAEHDLGYGFTDIRGPGDAFNWASYTAGNLLPMMAASVAGGGAGGIIAGQGAKMLAGATAKQAAKRAGQALGAAGASTGMETGAIMGETEDLDVSLAHGALAGSLDAITPVRLLRRTGAHELADKAADEISDGVLRDLRRQAGMTTRREVTRDGARTVAEEAGDSAFRSMRRGSLTNLIGEASTEGLQGLISQHANHWVENNGESLLGNLSEVDVKAMIDEAAAGGLMGGIVGAPAGLAERGQARGQVARIERAREQAAAQGGDPLDQTMAGQQAEQEAQAEDPGPQGPTPEQTGNLYQRLQRGLAVADELEGRDRDLGGVTRQRMRSATRKLDGADKAFERGDYREAESLLAQAETGFSQIDDDLAWMAQGGRGQAPRERPSQSDQPSGLLSGAMGETRATGPQEMGQPTDSGLPGFGPDDMPGPAAPEASAGGNVRERAMEAGRRHFDAGRSREVPGSLRVLPREDQDNFLAGWDERQATSQPQSRAERDGLRFRANGKPFASRRSAEMSKPFRDNVTRGADAVEVEGGWAIRMPEEGAEPLGAAEWHERRNAHALVRYANAEGPDQGRVILEMRGTQDDRQRNRELKARLDEAGVPTRLVPDSDPQMLVFGREQLDAVMSQVDVPAQGYAVEGTQWEAENPPPREGIDAPRSEEDARLEREAQQQGEQMTPYDFPEGYEPYLSMVRGRTEWTVPMERGKRQTGDTLHDGLDEALEQARRNVRDADRQAQNQSDMDAQAQQEGDRESRRQAEINEIGEILGLPDFRAGRARDVLQQRMRFDGQVMSRKARIEQAIEAGATVQGEGAGRRLMVGDGEFYEQKTLTKTGMDYAEALIARRGEPEADTAGPLRDETETVLERGDEGMSPYLSADGRVITTAGDHLEAAEAAGYEGYRDYQQATGAVRATLHVPPSVNPHPDDRALVSVHLMPGQRLTPEQLATIETFASRHDPEFLIGQQTTDALIDNPQYREGTLDELRQLTQEPAASTLEVSGPDSSDNVTPEQRSATSAEERALERLDRIRDFHHQGRAEAADLEELNAVVQEQLADPDTYDKLNTDAQMLERAVASGIRQRMQAAAAKPRGEVKPRPVADRPARPSAEVVRPEGRPRWRTKKAAEAFLEEADAVGLYTAEPEGKGWVLRREPQRTFEIQTRTRQSTAGADQPYTVNETVLLRPEGMDKALFEQVVKAQASAPVSFVQHKKQRAARLATRDAEKVVRHLEGEITDNRLPEERNDNPLTLFPAQPAGTVVDSIESPEAKAKVQRARREERDDGSEASRQKRRAESLLGASVGDVVTFSQAVGYAAAGREYRINNIDRNGNVQVKGMASGGSTVLASFDLQRAIDDGMTVTRAGQQAEAATEGWGDNNTLVSKDRAAEIRAKLKARLGTLNSGFDPEMLALGAELAAFHMEAGARKFGAFARAMASDLGTSVAELRPYLRGWYNGGRDMMEDSGLDVADMDSPGQVREAMQDLDALEAESEAQADPAASELSAEAAEALGQRLAARGLTATDPRRPDTEGLMTPRHFDRAAGEYTFDVRGLANAGVVLESADLQALERGERLTKRTQGTLEVDLEVGLSEAAAERSLAQRLYQDIDAITDNRKLKALLAEHHGIKPGEVTDGLLKEGQEAMEFALVRRARDLVREGGSDREVFDRLTAMYRHQPNLDVRSSSSMARQAYSTPAPLAFLASRLSGIEPGTSVYEPTAGNGMLLIGADIDQAIVNELDDRRAGHLMAQGFTVTQHDATQWIPKQGARAAIMNPPFGKLRHDDGSLAPVKVDGYTVKAIDHLIAAKALTAIPDDGRATLIIGANKKAGDIGAADRTFFNWLYSHYNVVGHFEADGDLYSRQGAGWPVRVITVNGRVRSDKISPKSGVIERAETWEQVYEQYERSLAAAQQPIPDSARADGDNQPDADDGLGGAARGDGQQDRPPGPRGRGRRGESPGDSRAGSRPGAGDPRGDQSGGVRTERAGSGQPVQRDVAQQAERGADPGARGARGAGDANAGQLGRRSEGGAESAVSGSQFQTAYQARSAGFNDAVLIPNSMAQPTQEALTALENAVGNLDQYVQNKLGYPSAQAMHEAFMGLQVDAVAASIYNIEQGKGIIIADQTGVGKGRQAAAVIRYAREHGKVPVFMSVKDNLFSDMYGDLRDIGDHDVKPFVVNQGAGITWQGQEVHKTAAAGKHRRQLREIADNGRLPEGHDALFLTYSQIRTDNLQRQVLEALGDNAVFVLDEAHEVSGEREKKVKGGGTKKTGAGFIYDLIDAKPVVYLSATYAKRPDNMPVYYRTDVSDAVDNVDQLVEAVQNGGVPLQTVVSNMLAASGQLFRRERSYEGISIETRIDTDNTDLHERVSDQVTEGLRAIIAADRRFHAIDMEGLQDAAEAAGGSATTAGNQASTSLDHQNFTSVLHNYIGQLLMGLKADKAADMAIDMHRRGIKPVMALENTMGSFLNEFAMENGLEDGDPVEATYRDVLSRALERTRRYSVTAANGDREPVQVSLTELEPSTRALYDEAQAVIDSLDLGDIPISPIDHMRRRLSDAGIRVAELTGRDRMIDYGGAQPTLTRRDAEERKNARGTVDAFNGGALDAIILNRSGSTGLSIHASERFTDQRERHMIVLQAPGDINILMQMLGRINRTGQVVKPGYTMMGLNIPAEKRPLAVTAKKMKSLNANTSANTESDTSVNAADILNKYGDQVVNEYLANNPALAETLDIAPSTSQSGELSAAPEGLAMKFTGRLATLQVAEQRAVYEDVERAYGELIDYLNKTGQNDLEPQTLDLDARIRDSKVIYQGKAPETIFGGHTYLHKVDAKYQGTPPSADDVKAALDKAAKQGSPEAQAKAILDTLEGDEGTLEASIRADEQKAAEIQREATQLRDQHGIRSGNTEEVVAALKERGEEKAARQVEKAQENHRKILERAEMAREVWARTRKQTQEALTDTFLIGNRVRLDLKEETVTGVVTDVKSSHRAGKGNPWALSKTRVKFMVNSGIRTIELPLSRLQPGEGMLLEQLQSRGTEGLGAIFKGDTGNMRETRYVATGNLIAAAAGKDRGRISSFTDSEGKTHLGLLMPKNYNAEQFEAAGTEQNIPLRQLDVAARFMRGQREALGKQGGVFTDGQVARITPVSEDRWEVSVPKANKEPIARAVKFNQALIDAMGEEFHGKGQRMLAQFDDSRLEQVLPAMHQVAPLHALPSFRPEWERAGGEPAPEAIQAFDPDSVKDDGTPRYSLLSRGEPTGTSQVALQMAVNDYPELGSVQVVRDPSGLPDAVLADMLANGIDPGQARGAYHAGTNYVVASNVGSVEEGVKAAVHEAVGHQGVRGVLGSELDTVMLQLYRSLPNSPQGRAALREVRRDYPFLDERQREDRAVIGEEAVAHLLEKGHRPKAWQRAVARIRSLLRRVFPSLEWTYTDVLALGERSRQRLRQEQAQRDGGNAVRYSLHGRPQSVASHYDDLDADQQAFVGKFGSQTPRQKATQWWKEKTDRLGLRLRQGLVDAQAALLELDKQALGDEEALTSQITKSSWVLGRMAHAANGAVHAMLNNGRIYLDPQERVIDVRDDDSKGLGAVLGQLGEAPEIERFMMWIAANRSQKLAGEGRENLFTEEEIAAGVRLNQGTLADGRDRNKAYEQTFAEFQQYRDDVLAIAEQSGLLKPAMTDYQALRAIAKQHQVPRALRDELRQAKRDINRADDPEVREMADERFDAAAYAVMQAAAEREGSMESVERLKDQLMTSQRELWAEEFYVPFYRLAEDKDKTQPGLLATNGLSRQQAYKRLKGGTSNINDLMQNTMMNFHHLIEASLKNQAATQAMDNAESLGIARAVSSTEAAGSKTSTFVLRDGQQVWYEIDDPMVYAAVTAMAHPGMNSTMMTVMRRFKRLFTQMTTTTPQFMVANLIRDTLQATATNDVSKNVIKNVMQGYGTYKDEQARARMLASGASFNFGHLYQGNPDELRAELTRTMRGSDIIRDPRDLKKVLKLWDRWNDMNNFAENVNRAAIYQQNMDAGRGKLYSAFESRDLIDFSARGAWPAVRILIDVVPFLNARIQGLDKIYRSGVKPGTNVVMAAFGKGQANVTDKQAAARFFTVAGALAAATIALYLHNEDDEEYQKLEEWHKDTYWWFRLGDAAISIPKPFEVGAIATLAERVTQQFVDDQATGELFRERLQHMVSDTFSFTVVPQMLQPAMNIYANKDDFTNRPIETMGMERLSPELRKRSSTTGIATATSRFLNATVGAIGDPDLNPLALSPVQIDHLIQGYFGQVGSFAVGTADVGWRSLKGEESPAKHWYERQPVRRFYQNLGLEDRYTRHGTVFYDGLREAQRAYSDVKELRELGELERAASLSRDKRGMLAIRKRLNRAQRRLSSINQRMELVRMSDVSGEVKRQRLDRLRAIKNQIQRVVSERLQDINA